MEDAGPSTGGRAVDSGSGSDNWEKYLNFSEENASAASTSPPSSSFFTGLSNMSPAPDLGEEVQQVSLAHSISQTEIWNSLSSSAPTPGQENQPPLVVEQAGPSQMAPKKEEVLQQLKPFLASFGNRESGKIFNRALEEIKGKLDLDGASPSKLRGIQLLMQELYGKPWTRAEAKKHFLKEIPKATQPETPSAVPSSEEKEEKEMRHEEEKE